MEELEGAAEEVRYPEKTIAGDSIVLTMFVTADWQMLCVLDQIVINKMKGETSFKKITGNVEEGKSR